MGKDVNLVIYSDAVPEENPERKAAVAQKIPSMSYFQFLGEYSKDKHTIAISGCHGKTTTTALTGLILDRAILIPWSLSVQKSKLGWQFTFGRIDYFVVEGDEYRAHMLELNPQVIILKNMEFDHPDYYRDLNHTIETFQAFINKLPADGHYIYNLDDPILHERIDKPIASLPLLLWKIRLLIYLLKISK